MGSKKSTCESTVKIMMFNCRKYEKDIRAALNLESVPKIIYADTKAASINKLINAYGNRGDLRAKGLFLHKKLPNQYKGKGLILIMEDSVATLAHELCHYKQWITNCHWLQRGPMKTLYYNTLYYFYPTEVEAFNFAERYVRESNLQLEYHDYKRLREALKSDNYKSLCKKASLVLLILADIAYLLH